MTTDRRALIRRGLFLILPLLLVAGLAWACVTPRRGSRQGANG